MGREAVAVFLPTWYENLKLLRVAEIVWFTFAAKYRAGGHEICTKQAEDIEKVFKNSMAWINKHPGMEDRSI